MIIWISGAYGVGKSALAEAMADNMESALIFDAEEVGNAVRGNYPDCPYGYIFEDYPLWGECCCLLLKDIHAKFPKDILVPMTLLRAKSYELIERLNRAGCPTKLVVLEADMQTLHDRILKRGEEEDCWCMENRALAKSGAEALPGIHIQTDGRSMDEICREAMEKLGFCPGQNEEKQEVK